MRNWIAVVGCATTVAMLIPGWWLSARVGTPGARTDQGACALEQPNASSHQRQMAHEPYRVAFERYRALANVRSADGRTPNPIGCFAEGTPKHVMEAFLNAMRSAEDGAWTLGGDREYQLRNRWSISGSTGDPIALTWSLVPDGTPWYGAPSNLFAQLDTRFASAGGRAAWVDAIQDSFDRWEYLSGVDFTRIKIGTNDWDDGATDGSNHAAGLRGHIRIGMNAIDGGGNVLAYNFFPDNGDMTLDQAENWGASQDGFRFLRNVVMHEAGHGLGFSHECSDDSNQLMEPWIDMTIDGPQHDDIRVVHRNYGDAFEPSNTPGEAYYAGDLTWGPTGLLKITYGRDIQDVALAARRSLFGNGDVDYLKFTLTKTSLLTLTLRPIGETYDDNAQAGDGSCPSGADTNSLNQADLELELRDSTGGYVLDSAVSNPAGMSEQIVYTAAPGTYHVRIYESGTPTQSQLYLLDHQAETLNQPPVISAITDKTVSEMVAFNLDANATDPNGDAITFSLSSAPAGMTIHPTTGLISWTPAEAQGPGSYTVVVRAIDDGDPNLDDTESFVATVSEVNRAPVLDSIPNKTVNEGSLVSFDANATDPDLPANTLTYSLSGAPTGMIINPNTGAVTWTPSEMVGPTTEVVTVIVKDNGTPQLQDSQSVTITVNEVNQPPELEAIANQTIDEGTELVVDANATDPDLPSNTLTFSLSGAPSGMTIDGATGVVRWTPGESAGPDVLDVTVIVKDNGSPQLQDSQRVQITVDEVNQPPVLDKIGNRAVDEQALLTFTATATDPDLPANGLKFSLIDAPAGASIGVATGVFAWTPTEAHGPGSYTFTVRVQDTGNPALSDTETISVKVAEVNRAPQLGTIGDQFVTEETLLQFTATASDPDVPANALSFSLAGAPVGASIDPSTGVFTWVPTEAQGPSVATFTVVVTDNGTPSRSDSETIRVTVHEAEKKLMGRVELGDFVGDSTSIAVTFEIRKIGSLEAVDKVKSFLAADGSYSATLGGELEAGDYDVTAQGPHWLRRLRSVVALDAFGASGVDFALVNGDVDGDNTITVFDYNALSDAFDTAVGDAGWNANADLDGDGAVTVFDYNILSANFDQVGDD